MEVVPGVLNVRFYEMYKDAWDFVESEQPDLNSDQQWKSTLEVFQQLLGEIPDWELDRIEEETESVIAELPYLREALRQMLIARVSILMSIRHDKRTRANFEFVMPPDAEIIHTFFIRAAKRLRGKAALYYHLVDEIVREDNTLEAEDIIRRSLEKSIPSLVPLQQVVQSHLIEPHDEEEEEAAAAAEDEAQNDDNADDGEDTENDDDAYDEYEEEGYEEEGYEEEGEDSDDEEGDEDEDEDEEDDDGVDDSIEQEVIDELPEEDYIDDGGELDDVSPDATAGNATPIAREDAPADKSAAAVAIFADDSPRKAELKKKASLLQTMIDELKAKRRRVPKKHKTVIASIEEEIASREAQMARVEKKLVKSGGVS